MRNHDRALLVTLVILAVVGTFHTCHAYTNVIPNQAELESICGPYVLPTANFTCANFSVSIGYFNCVRNVFACQCQAQSPARFQPNPTTFPCEINYGVETCAANETTYFCGPFSTGCTKVNKSISLSVVCLSLVLYPITALQLSRSMLHR